MKRQSTAPSSRQGGLRGASLIRRPFTAGLFALACALPATTLADPVNLIQNGDFSAGMSQWVKPTEFGVADPVANGEVAIYRPVANYNGPVVSQGIHATGIANTQVTVSAKLKRVFAPGGSSVRISLEFIRTGGQHEIVPVIQPDNASYAAGGAFSHFSANYTFPADAVKLIRASVEVVGNGSFKGDDLSVTGEVIPGPVPQINAVSPLTVAYGQPVTLIGSQFGTSTGTLTLDGSATDLTIESWSDTQIIFHLAHPSHGGKLVLTSQDVSANQTPAVRISSPHYQLANPTPAVVAIPGQVLEINAWLTFFNGYTSPAGIQLGLQGTGGVATFTPNPVANQGGSRLTLDTTGLAPGIRQYSITSIDQGVPGNQAPLTVDLRLPGSLDFAVVDPLLGNLPVTGTLAIETPAPVRTDYTLLDTNSADITSASPLVWASSNPAVLVVLPPANTSEGPSLIPLTNGTCNLTATAPNGFSRVIPISVDQTSAPAEITQIGFSIPEMDNSGEGDPNVFTAVAAEGGLIVSINHAGFAAVNPVYQYGSEGMMEFQIPQGLAPGLYEFSASSLTGANRAALLKVTNTPGTGMITGSVSKSFPYLTLKAGVLEFYHTVSNELAFSRDLDSYGGFRIGFIPPGNYRIRFVPDQEQVPVPLDSPWFANAKSIENAQTVTVSADSTTPGIHFFVYEVPQAPIEIVVPQIVNPVREGNTFSFDFNSLTGLRYTVEYSTSLEENDWHPQIIILGDGSPKTVTDSAASGPAKFYRIRVSAE